MKAEYFPPKEDVILQNEAPTDFYIVVTGSVVRIRNTGLAICIQNSIFHFGLFVRTNIFSFVLTF